MSEEQPAAVEVQATTAEATQTEQASVDTTAQVATQSEAVADDFSWVPAKFMVDGKPDFLKQSEAYKNLEKKIGTKAPNLAPDDIAEYVFESKLVFDEEATTAWKNEAKELKLSPEQYKAVMTKYEAGIDSITMNSEKAEVALKAAWGEKEFNSNLMNARKAFDEYAPSDINMDDPALNHPSVLKLLARIGSELGEDSAPIKATQAVGKPKSEIDAIMSEPDYWKNQEKQKIVSDWYSRNIK